MKELLEARAARLAITAALYAFAIKILPVARK